MHTTHARALAAVALSLLVVAQTVRADIYNWLTGEVIPGTQGITPGPGVDLEGWNADDHHLRYADFSGELDLTGARFGAQHGCLICSDWDDAPLRGSWLEYADFRGANLSNVDFGSKRWLDGGAGFYMSVEVEGARLTNADLSGTIIAGANFSDTGITQDQLYSTASYQQKDLASIQLAGNDLHGWDFSGQNLAQAKLGGQCVEGECNGADLSGANLAEANLRMADLTACRLTNADLSGTNLTGAKLGRATMANAELSGAVVTGGQFTDKEGRGSVTLEQLYSTASYQQKNLQGIRLAGNKHLTGADFSGQNLRNAVFGDSYDIWDPDFGWMGSFSVFSDLTGAKLIEADLTSASLRCSLLENADLRRANLEAVSFECHGSLFDPDPKTILTGANLRGAKVTDANPRGVVWHSAVYNQWTVFPADFGPDAEGLIYVETPTGDFDMDDVLDANDIDVLARRIRLGYVESNGYWNDALFDVNEDTVVDSEDHRTWVRVLTNTWYGDANLDSEFKLDDLTQVLEAGKYETQEYAVWAEGDWNGDGVFGTGDLVTALMDGGYERGPRPGARAVPEPNGALLLLTASSLCWHRRR